MMNDTKHPAGRELQAYRHGELTADMADRIAAHCATCEICGAELVELKRMDGLLAGIEAPELSHSVWPGVTAAQRRGEAGRLGPAFGFAAAGACAAGLVIGILLGPVQFSAETTTDEVAWTGPSSLLSTDTGSSLLGIYQADTD